MVNENTYFAADGSYGSSEGMIMADTTKWTREDWKRIAEASDNELLDIARELHERDTDNGN